MKDGFKGSRTIVIPRSIVSTLESDLFGAKLYITDIGHYPVATLHHINRRSGVPQHILIYCTNGNGWIELCGARHTITANQCFIIPAGVAHSYGSMDSDPWSIYWVHFNGELAKFYTRGLSGVINIYPNNKSRIYDRLQIFEDILTALDDGFSRENIEFAISSLYYFFGSIKYLNCYRSMSDKRDTDIIRRVISYMKDHIEQSITLQQICEYSGYSESYFSTIFKKKTGYTPINYMIQLRMQEACRLLSTTNLKLNQICHKIGIHDQYYFSKLFSKIIGTPPSKYRIANRSIVEAQNSEE